MPAHVMSKAVPKSIELESEDLGIVFSRSPTRFLFDVMTVADEIMREVRAELGLTESAIAKRLFGHKVTIQRVNPTAASWLQRAGSSGVAEIRNAIHSPIICCNESEVSVGPYFPTTRKPGCEAAG